MVYIVTSNIKYTPYKYYKLHLARTLLARRVVTMVHGAGSITQVVRPSGGDVGSLGINP